MLVDELGLYGMSEEGTGLWPSVVVAWWVGSPEALLGELGYSG